MKISYESSELIEELKEDIKEFGKDKKVIAFYKFIYDTKIYTNYDFIDEENPVTSDELLPDEQTEIITMEELLEKLEEQDKVL